MSIFHEFLDDLSGRYKGFVITHQPEWLVHDVLEYVRRELMLGRKCQHGYLLCIDAVRVEWGIVPLQGILTTVRRRCAHDADEGTFTCGSGAERTTLIGRQDLNSPEAVQVRREFRERAEAAGLRWNSTSGSWE